MINKSEAKSSEQFTVIGDSTQKSQSWQVIGDSHSSIAGDHEDPTGSLSSFDNLKKVMTGKRKGKTRAEAFAALDIEKAELLSTGEIRLPNGKIIGHRNFKHIYRQRLRLPDDREQVVINKLALEYRRIQKELTGGNKIAGGGSLMVYQGGALKQRIDPDLVRAQKKMEDRAKKDRLVAGMNQNRLMFYFVDRANNTI